MVEVKHYKHNKVVQFLYDYCLKGSKFLYKHPVIYWILQFTWGIIYTIIGSIIGFFAWMIGGEGSIFHRGYVIMIGDNWGGLELGLGCLVAYNMSDEWTDHCKKHEIGHCYQNALLGPFAIFLVTIPSAIRYWYQRIRTKKGLPNKDYESIWFEGCATEIGETLYGYLKEEKTK